jgi:hypothetical protein
MKDKIKNIDIDLDFANAIREFHDSLRDGDFMYCLAVRKEDDGEEESTHVAILGDSIQLQQYMTNDFISHTRNTKETAANCLEKMRETMFTGVAMTLALDKNLEKLFIEDLKSFKSLLKLKK